MCWGGDSSRNKRTMFLKKAGVNKKCVCVSVCFNSFIFILKNTMATSYMTMTKGVELLDPLQGVDTIF